MAMAVVSAAASAAAGADVAAMTNALRAKTAKLPTKARRLTKPKRVSARKPAKVKMATRPARSVAVVAAGAVFVAGVKVRPKAKPEPKPLSTRAKPRQHLPNAPLKQMKLRPNLWQRQRQPKLPPPNPSAPAKRRRMLNLPSVLLPKRLQPNRLMPSQHLLPRKLRPSRSARARKR